MKLVLVRHGETEANLGRVLQGLNPGKLSKVGIDQSKALGRFLKKYKIDVIYCSPIDRCQETLKYIMEETGWRTKVVHTPLIQERDFGKFSGKPHSEIDFEQLDQETEHNLSMGVESQKNVNLRVKRFLDEVREKHPKSSVLVVSHSNPIRWLLSNLLKLSFEEVISKVRIDNASTSIFEQKGEGYEQIMINETGYLK